MWDTAGGRLDELINDVLQWTPSHRRAKVGRPARTYYRKLCADTGCSQEYLLGAMGDRDGKWEKDWEICASSVTWWWWWHILSTLTATPTCVRNYQAASLTALCYITFFPPVETCIFYVSCSRWDFYLCLYPKSIWCEHPQSWLLFFLIFILYIPPVRELSHRYSSQSWQISHSTWFLNALNLNIVKSFLDLSSICIFI